MRERVPLEEIARDLRRTIGAALWVAGAVSIVACGETSPEPKSSFKVLSQPVAAAGPPKPDPALWETPLEDTLLEQGREVWVGTCITCHSTGLGGAPLIGNPELWEPRIAKGIDALVEHATHGFFGTVGEMPARGGNESLSDEQIRAAVHFMTSRVR